MAILRLTQRHDIIHLRQPSQERQERPWLPVDESVFGRDRIRTTAQQLTEIPSGLGCRSAGLMHDSIFISRRASSPRLGDEGLRLMHLVPAPAVRLSCKDECYPDQALTVYWLKDNMRLA